MCVFVLGFLLLGSFMILFNYVGYLLLGPPYGLSQAAVRHAVLDLPRRHLQLRLDGDGSRTGTAGRRCLEPGWRSCSWAPRSPCWGTFGRYCRHRRFVFGFFGAHSVASGLVGERADKDSKAQASSLYLLSYYAGASVVGTAGGLLWDPYGWTGVVISIIALLVLALVATAALWTFPARNLARGE